MEASPRVPTRLLVLALGAYSLAHLANNTLLAAPAVRDLLARLQDASGGWIEPVLLKSWVVLGAFLAVVLGLGRRAWSEVGWRPGTLARGAATWLLAWVALQVVLLLWTLARGTELALHPMWTRFGTGAVLGGILAQALGHALAEDTAFRAFTLPALGERARRLGPWTAALVALVGSSVLFGLTHLPTRLLVKSPGGAALLAEQAHFFTAGLALGLAWLATRNLGAVVALHVLLNDPAPLVATDGTSLNRAVLVVLAVVIGGAAWRARRQRPVELAPADELKRAA